MCQRIGAEPLIVVNIGTETWNGEVDPQQFLQDVRDWIEYCNGPASSKWGQVRAANGHPEPYGVKYWEIDNETWHMGAEQVRGRREHVRPGHEAGRSVDQARRLRERRLRRRRERPGLESHDHRTAARPVIDYLSIHHYEEPGRV